jgi:hypothetical protein
VESQDMMNQKHFYAIYLILIYILLSSSNVYADDVSSTIEKKRAAIKIIMSSSQVSTYIQHDREFCSMFIRDFKFQNKIEHIKPVMETENYDQMVLTPYFNKCSKKEFNKTYEIRHPRGMQEIAEIEATGKEVTDKEMEEAGGIAYRATKNVKLYKIDINNNKKNGDEFVLYAEGYQNNVSKQYTYGRYSIVNLDKCTIDGEFLTNDPYDYYKKKSLDNYNGIILYKGKYFLFDMSQSGNYRELQIGIYEDKIKNIKTICGFRINK